MRLKQGFYVFKIKEVSNWVSIDEEDTNTNIAKIGI